MKVLFGVISFVLLTACSKKTFGLNEAFSLKYGHSMHLNSPGNNQIEIEYLDISEESRCPPGTQCVWAGRVAVVLKLNNQSLDTLGLNHSEYSSVSECQGKMITLLDVIYNSDDDFGKKEKSTIKLIVE
jgi:hypothetical protein